MTNHGHRIPVHIVRKRPEEVERVKEAAPENKESETSTQSAPEAQETGSQELEQMREQWMRTAADLDNLRKRMTRQIESESTRQRERVLESFLPVVDNLERALQSANGAHENPWVQGMEAIRNQMLDTLKNFGIEPFDSTGENFDPHHHDAVAHVPQEGATPGTVIEETLRGYRRDDDSVLRHAKVVVAS